jgi:hypothetical protein
MVLAKVTTSIPCSHITTQRAAEQRRYNDSDNESAEEEESLRPHNIDAAAAGLFQSENCKSRSVSASTHFFCIFQIRETIEDDEVDASYDPTAEAKRLREMESRSKADLYRLDKMQDHGSEVSIFTIRCSPTFTVFPPCFKNLRDDVSFLKIGLTAKFR